MLFEQIKTYNNNLILTENSMIRYYHLKDYKDT